MLIISMIMESNNKDAKDAAIYTPVIFLYYND